MSSITLSFYRARSIRNALWYFRQMVEARPALAAVNGLTFHRLLGTGRGDGFSPWPDTRDVGLLQVWQDRAAAEAYFNGHPLESAFMARATERYRLWLKTRSMVMAVGPVRNPSPTVGSSARKVRWP